MTTKRLLNRYIYLVAGGHEIDIILKGCRIAVEACGALSFMNLLLLPYYAILKFQENLFALCREAFCDIKSL